MLIIFPCLTFIFTELTYSLFVSTSMMLTFFLSPKGMTTSVRITARDIFRINGNPLEDFFAALLYYPGVALQLEAAAADAAAAMPSAADVADAEKGSNNPGYVPEAREVSKL